MISFQHAKEEYNDLLNGTDEETQEKIYKEYVEKLTKQYPQHDDFFIATWAYLFAYMEVTTGASIEIEMDRMTDPSKITLTLTPDYGS